MVSSIISQILELIYRTVTIFSFDHMTDENRSPSDELHFVDCLLNQIRDKSIGHAYYLVDSDRFTDGRRTDKQMVFFLFLDDLDQTPLQRVT